MIADLGLNRRAARLADALAADAALLGVAVTEVGGARVLDCGVLAAGGLEAGRRLAEICLAGLATVSFTSVDLGGLWLPAVAVDHRSSGDGLPGQPVCRLGHRPAGILRHGLGTGPQPGPGGAGALRADRLRGGRRHRGARAGGAGASGREGGAVRRRQVPRPAGGPRLLIAPTASIAGCVQVAARSVETGLHKMLELGFDVRSVRSGAGVCPLAPVAKNDLRAIGWTNDCILYGTRAYFAVHADDAEVAAMVERLPASTSSDYGTPFYEIFKRAGNQFYKIDRMLFSPAEVVVNNLASGRVFRAGRLDPERAEGDRSGSRRPGGAGGAA